jgi:hypothetical protein
MTITASTLGNVDGTQEKKIDTADMMCLAYELGVRNLYDVHFDCKYVEMMDEIEKLAKTFTETSKKHACNLCNDRQGKYSLWDTHTWDDAIAGYADAIMKHYVEHGDINVAARIALAEEAISKA